MSTFNPYPRFAGYTQLLTSDRPPQMAPVSDLATEYLSAENPPENILMLECNNGKVRPC